VTPRPPLLTLTGNLLAERTLEFTAWQPGRTQRATRETFQVGGKGINVAKMLGRLGPPATALCFAGGATGAACEDWLRTHGFTHRAFATTTATRTGTVVRADGQPETTFLGPDVAPDAAAVRACADFLDAEPEGGVLALCGSLPGWPGSDFDPLRRALQRWARRGTLVADTYGPPLAWCVQQPLSLVKINADEFCGLDGRRAPVSAGALLATAARSPVRRWIVTQGAGPVWLQDLGGEPVSLIPPAVREVSATGSGDVLLAGVLHAWLRLGLHLRDAVAFALPYAAANAQDPGVADFALPPKL
jgi:fructose-1-phosphate kinase PfkB-like protein